jgi:gliding motility-associated protein GldE
LDNEPPSLDFLTIADSFNATGLIPLIPAVVILLSLSAMVSASEIAFFSLSASQIESLRQQKDHKSILIVKLLDKPRHLLATILISNNFVNVGIVILSTYIIHMIFDFSASPLAAFLVEVVAVTFMILLFGEILPKVYASAHPLPVARFMSAPIKIANRIFLPLIMVLAKTSHLFETSPKTNSFNVNDLSHALELTEGENQNEEEQKMLQGIVKFGNTAVRQVMTSRTEIICLDIHDTFDAVIQKIVDNGFSRLPVFEENLDTIKGIIYIKDLLPYLDAQPGFAWQQLIRDPFFIPETKKIDDLLLEFQTRKTHLAIVVDEYGGTSGIITLEDIIEEIVGEISDEFDNEDLIYSKLDQRTFVFEGKTPLNDFYKVLKINGDSFEAVKGDADTLAGLLLEVCGKFPQKNEIINFNDFEFKIEHIEGRRIQRIKVIIPDPAVS